MARAALRRQMRPFRKGRRGLAEIVGTLMLVVIVVAAATAFSFFVSAYEKQVLAQENQQHDRALETGRLSGIEVCSLSTCPGLYCSNNTTLQNATIKPCVTDYQHLPTLAIQEREYVLNLSFVSADVNPMFFTEYQVDGLAPEGWLLYTQSGTPQWMEDTHYDPANWSACQPTTNLNGSVVAANSSCSEVPAFQQVNISLVYLNSIALPISIKIFTSLADSFSYNLVPPVPIIKTTVLPQGSYFEPLFDGSGSYQPAGGDNASIVGYTWDIVDKTNSSYIVPLYYGPQIEVVQLSSGSTTTSNEFLVTLTVANSDGLSASTSVVYEN